MEIRLFSLWPTCLWKKTKSHQQPLTWHETSILLTVCRVCREGVLCMVGCGLRVGLGEVELARVAVGILSCSILLERPPFTSLPTLFRPMEEKKRRRKSFGLPSSFL